MAVFFAYWLRDRDTRLRLDFDEFSAVGKAIVSGRRTLRYVFGIDRIRRSIRGRPHCRPILTERPGAPSFQRGQRSGSAASLERAPARSGAEPVSNFSPDRAANWGFLALIPHETVPF